MNFLEALPDLCPPRDAADAAYPAAFRFVKIDNKDDLCDEHFLSHAALGQSKPLQVDGCSWASCSLFESRTCADYVRVSKIPKFKNKRIAKLNVPFGTGLSMRSSGGHINLWAYHGCALPDLVQEIFS
jgi:hypothetical protein